MIKKFSITVLALLALYVFLGCAPEVEEPTESPVDEVETDILDISDIDEELDTNELDDIDEALEDIENI